MSSFGAYDESSTFSPHPDHPVGQDPWSRLGNWATKSTSLNTRTITGIITSETHICTCFSFLPRKRVSAKPSIFGVRRHELSQSTLTVSAELVRRIHRRKEVTEKEGREAQLLEGARVIDGLVGWARGVIAGW